MTGCGTTSREVRPIIRVPVRSQERATVFAKRHFSTVTVDITTDVRTIITGDRSIEPGGRASREWYVGGGVKVDIKMAGLCGRGVNRMTVVTRDSSESAVQMQIMRSRRSVAAERRVSVRIGVGQPARIGLTGIMTESTFVSIVTLSPLRTGTGRAT